VIAASALSLLYPTDGIDGYSRDAFLEDLMDEAASDIKRCLERGAHNVQIDFTEGRLSVKLNPSKGLLRQFVELNNRVLERFSEDERTRIGSTPAPAGTSTRLPARTSITRSSCRPLRNQGGKRLLASESERRRVLGIIRDHARPGQRVFVGVIDAIDPRVETAKEVRDRVLEAAEFLSPAQLGTCDDCGFSPFGDDASTARDTAFAKIQARVEGTRLAAEKLGF
jgi:5-methyltetrahydropteroyltriglutamate--homocysteine methyltransferase